MGNFVDKVRYSGSYPEVNAVAAGTVGEYSRANEKWVG